MVEKEPNADLSHNFHPLRFFDLFKKLVPKHFPYSLLEQLCSLLSSINMLIAVGLTILLWLLAPSSSNTFIDYGILWTFFALAIGVSFWPENVDDAEDDDDEEDDDDDEEEEPLPDHLLAAERSVTKALDAFCSAPSERLSTSVKPGGFPRAAYLVPRARVAADTSRESSEASTSSSSADSAVDEPVASISSNDLSNASDLALILARYLSRSGLSGSRSEIPFVERSRTPPLSSSRASDVHSTMSRHPNRSFFVFPYDLTISRPCPRLSSSPDIPTPGFRRVPRFSSAVDESLQDDSSQLHRPIYDAFYERDSVSAFQAPGPPTEDVSRSSEHSHNSTPDSQDFEDENGMESHSLEPSDSE